MPSGGAPRAPCGSRLFRRGAARGGARRLVLRGGARRLVLRGRAGFRLPGRAGLRGLGGAVCGGVRGAVGPLAGSKTGWLAFVLQAAHLTPAHVQLDSAALGAGFWERTVERHPIAVGPVAAAVEGATLLRPLLQNLA